MDGGISIGGVCPFCFCIEMILSLNNFKLAKSFSSIFNHQWAKRSDLSLIAAVCGCYFAPDLWVQKHDTKVRQEKVIALKFVVYLQMN